MTFKPKFILFLSAALALFGIGGCNLYPDSETRVEDLDITLTHYDKENDFMQNQTYSIVDEVVEIDSDTNNAPSPVANSDLIIQQIEANMAALGYTKVNDNQDPDLRVVATATENTQYFIITTMITGIGMVVVGMAMAAGGVLLLLLSACYPVVESYTSGTLIMQMAQYKDTAPGDTIKMVWTGVVNGLLDEDTQANLKTRIKSSIDEAFEQSPYLKVE
ncbi:MAG: DUF4136 domain-containing protein [Chitinophagales bacterium]|nr:DUF4136 domain-containing protein [Chitinophagales bacterium]